MAFLKSWAICFAFCVGMGVVIWSLAMFFAWVASFGWWSFGFFAAAFISLLMVTSSPNDMGPG